LGLFSAFDFGAFFAFCFLSLAGVAGLAGDDAAGWGAGVSTFGASAGAVVVVLVLGAFVALVLGAFVFGAFGLLEDLALDLLALD
jgi:hypothetical protein